MKKRLIPVIVMLVMMVAIVTCFAIMTSAEETTNTTLPTASNGEVIDVWLVAGQSNAIGAAKVDNYPTDEAYAEYKTLLTNGSQNVWHLRNTYTEFVPAGFSQGSGTQCGPELGITTALDNSANKNAIIKVAYGNTCLYENTTSKESINYGTWTPPSYIESHNINTVGNRTGDLYLTFMAKVAEGLEQLIAAGYTPNIKGVWYMQGEADTLTSSTTTERYEELLLTLISDMRADLTEISGYDCSELPFVYGRILSNHVNVGKDVPSRLTQVQTAQDNVANNTSLKNVFMINTSTDLVDPVTGQHRLPVQQDGWHYDSLSQQMIGEKFVSLVNGVDGITTKYGYIPEQYADVEKYPFAIFKKVDGGYVFDSVSEYNIANPASDSSWATIMTRAITLTKSNGTAVTEEAVVLLRRDLDTKSFLTNTSDIGETVTVDLNGYTFVTRTSFCNTKTDDCLASGATEAKDGIINIKNGTLLLGGYGILYSAKNGTYTMEKTLTFNIENVHVGFVEGSTSKTLIGIAYDSHPGEVVAKYEMNFVNCTLDGITNCPTRDDFVFADLTASGESDANGYNNAVSITFKNCTLKAKDIKHLDFTMSAEGDSVTFFKGDDGSFAKLILPDGSYSKKFNGVDDGYAATIGLKTKNETATDGKIYYLVATSDVETPYGVIPAASANSYASAYAIFKKIDGVYVFDSVQGDVQKAFERATALTHVKTGVTDDVVIYVRKSHPKDGSYPSNVSDIGGTVTLDLNGYTIRPTTALLRTDWDDDGVVDGVQKTATVNIKNGSIEVCQFGILFTTLGTTYTVPKTFNLNLENVNLSFYESTKNGTGTRKYMDLLVSDRSNSSTVNAYVNVTATNCVFDLATNSRDVALLATLDCGNNDKDTNDYNVKIIGGTIITDNIGKVNCHTKGSGDSFTFQKNSDGKYTQILMRQDLVEPATTEFRIADNGNNLSFIETKDKVGVYKVYDMCEDVMTKYGRIPYAAAVNNFAIFVRNGSDGYTYYGAYTGWKLAFEAAAAATDGSDTDYDEAVIFMLRDTTETSTPYYGGKICGVVNVDLDGKTLTVKSSLFNTYLQKNNGPVATINIFNGTLRTTNYGLVYSGIVSGDTSYEEAGVAKTINVNFENVTVGFAENSDLSKNQKLIANAYTGSGIVNTTINMNFVNCSIDLVTNASSTSTLGEAKGKTSAVQNTCTVDYNLSFTGCEFFVVTPSQITLATISEEGDSYVINKGADGKYATVITNAAKEEVYADIIPGNDGAKAVKLRTSYVGNVDGKAKYELVETDGNITVNTAYGVIPEAYVNIASNPFVIFYKATKDSAYVFDSTKTTYTLAMDRAVALTSATLASPAYEVVILMRSDTICSNFPKNISNIATTVTVDLNGYELQALQSLGNTTTGDVKDPNGNIVKTNATINYKNGSLLMKIHPALYIAKGTTYTAGYQKTLNINFDNIYIGFAEVYTAPALLGRIASNLTTETAFFNLKYTNCVIDMLTNRSTNSSLVIGNWATTSGADTTVVTVDFVDCDFIGLTEADFVHRTTAGQDVVRYLKTSGNDYATLTLPKDAAAPTGTYLAGDFDAKFVKISETDTTVTYALRPIALIGLEYAPKVSLTLDRNIVMNVYIPVNSTLNFTFNGVSYTNLAELADVIVTLDDGKDYYRMTVELPAAEAAQDIELTVALGLGEESVTGKFTFSTLKYAGKLIANGNDVEKQLAKDVVAYVKAAYNYFTTVNDAKEIARVNTLADELLAIGGAYNGKPSSSGSVVTVAPVMGVTLNLDAKPSIRFYVNDTSVKFYVDGRRVDTVSGTDSNGAYVELDVYAYALSGNITYGDGGSYHISDFLAKSAGEDHENLVACFIKYVESAAAYRASVIGA